MTVTSNTKPCLVETSQGFSVTYKNHLLYSKYSPAKNILSIVEKTDVLPGTIILCFSPILQYGLNEIASKLPENCLMFGIEADKELHDLADAQTKSLEIRNNGIYTLLDPDQLIHFPSKLEKMAESGVYRRVISLDFSGAINFSREFYNNFFEACRNTISQFWKNRITLVKFGRKYSSNLFKNLANLKSTLTGLKTDKSILVVGAGESATKTLENIKAERKDFFIISVDVMLPCLKSLNIKPDAVICEESQTVITKAFSGCKDWFDYLFVSSTASPSVTRLCPEKNIFYTPEFCKSKFLANLLSRGLLKNNQKPLGSVGLSAVEIALKLRSSDTIPVYVTGLDFSYSIGQTHSKMSLHEKTRRSTSLKIKTFENYASSYGNDSHKVIGKNNSTVITTTALSSYAELFRYKFQNTNNLFDVGKTGLELCIPTAEKPVAVRPLIQIEEIRENLDDTKIKSYLSQEKNALLQLKDLFTGKEKTTEDERTKKITALLENREYLFLHFPDGYKLNLSQDFLNRIRIEIDYFLKIFG